MPGPVAARLSKSRFCSGLQCPKQLWWRVREPGAPELEPGPALRAVLDRGRRVGEAARQRFPGGVLVWGDPRDLGDRVEKTRRAIAAGAPAVFEAAFFEDGVFVAVDVLERRRRGFVLCEVKSTLEVKEEHLPDVAVQLHVVRRAGLEVRRAEVMHLDRSCRFPDLSSLFVRENVTRDVEKLLPSIPRDVRRLLEVVAGPIPDVAPGPQCTEPHECPFLARCWPELPEHHVSTLYRIGERAEALVEAGIETIRDLPEDAALPAIAARQARSVREGKIVVEDGLAEALAGIEPPIAFLDFETVMPAIPVWDGCHPYEQVPVLMSCRMAGPGGRPRHFDFLARGPGDPRPAVADAVIRACRGARTVVAYGADFERRCLEHLAANLPGRRKALRGIAQRLVDLLPVVRDHVYHPAFRGRFGLKSVAPALVAGLGYGDLEIGEGAAAQATLEALLLDAPPVPATERRRLALELRRYCGRDTLALAKVYRRLRSLA
jgi:predicted RecB family nuclease